MSPTGERVRLLPEAGNGAVQEREQRLAEQLREAQRRSEDTTTSMRTRTVRFETSASQNQASSEIGIRSATTTTSTSGAIDGHGTRAITRSAIGGTYRRWM